NLKVPLAILERWLFIAVDRDRRAVSRQKLTEVKLELSSGKRWSIQEDAPETIISGNPCRRHSFHIFVPNTVYRAQRVGDGVRKRFISACCIKSSHLEANLRAGFRRATTDPNIILRQLARIHRVDYSPRQTLCYQLERLQSRLTRR